MEVLNGNTYKLRKCKYFKMSILDLKSIAELKATNSPLSNDQLTGITEQVVDRQDDNPLSMA